MNYPIQQSAPSDMTASFINAQVQRHLQKVQDHLMQSGGIEINPLAKHEAQVATMMSKRHECIGDKKAFRYPESALAFYHQHKSGTFMGQEVVNGQQQASLQQAMHAHNEAINVAKKDNNEIVRRLHVNARTLLEGVCKRSNVVFDPTHREAGDTPAQYPSSFLER